MGYGVGGDDPCRTSRQNGVLSAVRKDRMDSQADRRGGSGRKQPFDGTSHRVAELPPADSTAPITPGTGARRVVAGSAGRGAGVVKQEAGAMWEGSAPQRRRAPQQRGQARRGGLLERRAAGGRDPDDPPPLGSYMDPDSDDEMPPLVSASDSSDSETDDEGTPRRENRRASSQRSIRRNEPSTGGPNQQCGCENVTGSGVKYEDYIQKGHPERQPSRRTLGRDIFLDGCVQQNAEVSFRRENPYPKCTVCAGKSGKTRWQRYEDYKVATTLNEAKRLGASRVHLQQDLRVKVKNYG